MEAGVNYQQAETAARLRQCVAATSLALLVTVAATFLIRRLGGSGGTSLTAPALLMTGVALAALGALSRFSWRASDRVLILLWLVPVIPTILLALSLPLQASPIWSIVVFWLILIAAESGLLARRLTSRRGGLEKKPTVVATHDRATKRLRSSDATLVLDDSLPPEVSQRITRARNEDGAEILSGVLRGEFLPSERTQNLHVAFCPPLDAKPSLTFEQIDGPPATIKAAQVESFGARLDVRLAASMHEPTSVVIEFFAQTEADAA